MTYSPKDLPHEILDATAEYPLHEAVKRYNELANKDNPGIIPVLVMRMVDFLDDKADEEPSGGNLPDNEL